MVARAQADVAQAGGLGATDQGAGVEGVGIETIEEFEVIRARHAVVVPIPFASAGDGVESEVDEETVGEGFEAAQAFGNGSGGSGHGGST